MILTVNSGSSNIKFALLVHQDAPERTFSGQITSVGSLDTRFKVNLYIISVPMIEELQKSHLSYSGDKLVLLPDKKMDRRFFRSLGGIDTLILTAGQVKTRPE